MIKKRITPVRDGNISVTSVKSMHQIKKRITPVRDGNSYNWNVGTSSISKIKKRITPVRDGNCQESTGMLQS